MGLDIIKLNIKGFTLVELLAVIVILSVLAILTSYAVTNALKKSKDSLYDNQIDLIKVAAEAWGSENTNKISDSETCKYITLKNLQDYGILDENIVNPKTNEEFPADMAIKITTEVTEYGNLNIVYEVDSDEISDCYPVYMCKLADNGDLAPMGISEGDIIQCGAHESFIEYFYVVENDGTYITMLTKYNLDVGLYYNASAEDNLTIEDPTGLQNENAKGAYINSEGVPEFDKYYGLVPFSSTNYWNNSIVNYPSYVYNDKSSIKQYIYAYSKKLQEKGIRIKEARLISYEELDKLGCAANDACPLDKNWIYLTTYWTGSASNTNEIYYILSNGEFSTSLPDETGMIGVRPILKLLSSDIVY